MKKRYDLIKKPKITLKNNVDMNTFFSFKNKSLPNKAITEYNKKLSKNINNVNNISQLKVESLIVKYVKKQQKFKKRITKIKKFKRLYILKKRFRRLKKKNKFISEFFLLWRDSLKFKFRIKFDISVRKNNIFCTEIDLYRKHFLLRCSTGKYNLHSTKKKLKYTSRRMLEFFISLVRKTHRTIVKKKSNQKKIPYYRHTILNVSAPIKRRYKLFKRFLFLFKRKRFNIINLNAKKCFNGCRALKRNHRKSLSRQIFK
jgi:hypothetical protein